MKPVPKCDMTNYCTAPIRYIDAKGFAYCECHGKERQSYQRCRKLRPHELKKILSGKPLGKY